MDVVCTSLCKWRRTTRYNCLQKKKKRNRKLKFHNLRITYPVCLLQTDGIKFCPQKQYFYFPKKNISKVLTNICSITLAVMIRIECAVVDDHIAGEVDNNAGSALTVKGTAVDHCLRLHLNIWNCRGLQGSTITGRKPEKASPLNMSRMLYRHNKKSRIIPAHTYKKMQNVGKKKSSVHIQLSGWL